MNLYHIGASTLGFQACHHFVENIRCTINQQKNSYIIHILCTYSQLLISSSKQKATVIVLCDLKLVHVLGENNKSALVSCGIHILL